MDVQTDSWTDIWDQLYWSTLLKNQPNNQKLHKIESYYNRNMKTLFNAFSICFQVAYSVHKKLILNTKKLKFDLNKLGSD